MALPQIGSGDRSWETTMLRSVHARHDERTRPLPGDEIITPAVGSLTHAITIRRPRHDVWPWLLQMGAGRAGWYSYDIIDNGGHQSAERIVPELQHPTVGDIFPALPGEKKGFILLRCEAARYLVLGWRPSPDAAPIMTWAFVLEEPASGTTRLIVRARAGGDYQPPFDLPSWTITSLVPAGHYFMQRKQLLGIARRAEGRPRANLSGLIYGALTAATLIALYMGVFRPWHQHWGATNAEIARSIPGDDLVADPQEVTTRAITIQARADDVWPWLAQMGWRRGGLYSYDWLDRLFGVLDRPSADSLLPDLGGIEAGDTIPVGGSAGWPVALARANDVLLLNIRQEGAHVTWAFALYPVSANETRLVMRVRARLPRRWNSPIIIAILDPAEFLMVRRQLIGIRERAERLTRARAARTARDARQ
jgi:hypothetical protein